MTSSSSMSYRLKKIVYDLEHEEQMYESKISSLQSMVNTLKSEIQTQDSRMIRMRDLMQERDLKIQLLESQKLEFQRLIELDKSNLNAEVIALRLELAGAYEKIQKLQKHNENSSAPVVMSSNGPESIFDTVDEITSEMISPKLLLSAASHGLNGVIRSVLQVNQDPTRKAKLEKLLGHVLLDLCSRGTETLDLIQLLIRYGADLSIRRSKKDGGRNALHIAAAKGHLELVEFLLQSKSINIDEADANGRTPLHLAAKQQKAETVRTLLMQGANPTILTPEGFTAEQLANETHSPNATPGAKNAMSRVFESPTVKFWNHSTLGLRLYKLENWPDAHAHFSKALEVVDANPTVIEPDNKSRLYYNRAKVSMKMRDLSDALDDCDEALAINPNYYNALEIRAECYNLLFDFHRAAADFATLKRRTDSSANYQHWHDRHIEATRNADATHYEILGIPKDTHSVTTEDVRRAFRKESIKWHPDKHNKSRDDSHRARLHFQRINEAKEILSDTQARLMYDAKLLYSTTNTSSLFRNHGVYFSDDEDSESEGSYFEKRSLKTFPWNDPIVQPTKKTEPIVTEPEVTPTSENSEFFRGVEEDGHQSLFDRIAKMSILRSTDDPCETPKDSDSPSSGSRAGGSLDYIYDDEDDDDEDPLFHDRWSHYFKTNVEN